MLNEQKCMNNFVDFFGQIEIEKQTLTRTPSTFVAPVACIKTNTRGRCHSEDVFYCVLKVRP